MANSTLLLSSLPFVFVFLFLSVKGGDPPGPHNFLAVIHSKMVSWKLEYEWKYKLIFTLHQCFIRKLLRMHIMFQIRVLPEDDRH